MALPNDAYCQLCERFINKEERKKPLYSSRQLHRKMNGYWPAYFLQKKLVRDENAFWKIFFESRDIKEVEEFGLTNFYDDNNYGKLFLKRQ